MKIQLTLGDKGVTAEEALEVLKKLICNTEVVIQHTPPVASLLPDNVLLAAAAMSAANPPIVAAVAPAAPIAPGINNPITPVANDYVQGSGLGIDAEGLPWDERIHSSNKKRTAKNIWVERRNVTDETYNAVVAELRGATPASVPTPPPAPAAPVVENPADAFKDVPAYLKPPATTVPQAPVAAVAPPAAPVVPAVPTPPPAPTPARSIGDLITRIQGLFANSTADAQYVTNLQTRVGAQFGITVASITDIQARPDAIQYALDLIAADGK